MFCHTTLAVIFCRLIVKNYCAASECFCLPESMRSNDHGQLLLSRTLTDRAHDGSRNRLLALTDCVEEVSAQLRTAKQLVRCPAAQAENARPIIIACNHSAVPYDTCTALQFAGGHANTWCTDPLCQSQALRARLSTSPPTPARRIQSVNRTNERN
jgi:hypothetical protein